MCLIAFALHAAPGLPLLLAGNRDEALDRPTLPLHHWLTPGGTPVVGGRDGRDGGTWLAATGPQAARQRVAFLTNVRWGVDAGTWPRSRGELPLRWLDGEPLERWVASLNPAAHGAFNLVVGDLGTGQWHWLTNRDTQHRPALRCQALAPGVYGLSNAALDTPWPKTLALRAALQAAVERDLKGGLPSTEPNANTLAESVAEPNAPTAGLSAPPPAEARLWATLAQKHTWPDAALPQTGVPLHWERALSAIWVDHPGATGERGSPAAGGYGTRTSALLSVRQSPGDAGRLAWVFAEHTWRPEPLAGRRIERWTTALAAQVTSG